MKKLIFAALLLIFSAYSSAREYKPEEYLSAFENYSFADEDAVKALNLAGLSDARIFDPLDQYVQKNMGNMDDSTVIKAVIYALEGLSYSGNGKYHATIEKAAFEGGHKKVKKAASEALAKLDQFAKWNPLINPNHNNYKAGYPGVKDRIKNMLSSGDDILMSTAARRVYDERWYDDVLLDAAAKSIDGHYQQVDDDASLDAMVWLMRATAASKKMKYKSLIEKVMETTDNKQLRKYAQKYLGYF